MTKRHFSAFVAGGSAGALDALFAILPALPQSFTLPFAIVLHLHPSRRSHLAEVLGGRCSLKVKEAEDKEPLADGTIYVAPPNYHLLVEKERHFSLSVDEPVYFSRPAIDVLFETAADAYGPELIGLLLAGASEDGARGLSRIKAAGGMTLVQAPGSAPVPTMPDAALRMFRADHVLPPDEIGIFLAHLGKVAMETKEGA